MIEKMIIGNRVIGGRRCHPDSATGCYFLPESRKILGPTLSVVPLCGKIAKVKAGEIGYILLYLTLYRRFVSFPGEDDFCFLIETRKKLVNIAVEEAVFNKARVFVSKHTGLILESGFNVHQDLWLTAIETFYSRKE